MYLFSMPDGNVYNIQEEEFIQVGSPPLTVDMFSKYGNTELNVNLIQSTPNITIHYYTEESVTCGLELQANAVYTGKKIIQLDDFIVPSIAAITVKMLVSLPKNATLKILISVDEGDTWRTLRNDEWVESTINNISTDGMLLDTINTLSKSKLQELIPSAGTIRFAYYLEQATATDRIVIERTRVNYDLPQ